MKQETGRRTGQQLVSESETLVCHTQHTSLAKMQKTSHDNPLTNNSDNKTMTNEHCALEMT